VPGASGFVKKGYTFTGWNSAPNGTGTAYAVGSKLTVPANDTKLYAQWKINVYKLTFNSNGGTSVPSQSIEYLGKAKQPVKPKKSGYVFEGWGTSPDGDDMFDFDAPITGNLTLHAKWHKIPTIEIDGGSERTVETDQPWITGTSTASDGTLVVVDICGQKVTTEVRNGKWSVKAPSPLTDGVTCKVIATIKDKYGDVVDSQDIKVDTFEKLSHKIFIYGYPDGLFKPKRSIIRSEMAAILVRLIGQQSKRPVYKERNKTYSDINKSQWYYTDIMTLTNYGLMTGYPDGTFRPDDVITGDEIRSLVINYVVVMTKKYGNIQKAVCSKCKTSFHLDEVNKFLKKQRMTGASSAFTRKLMTRAEILTVMNRLFFRGPLTQLKVKDWPDVSKSYWAYSEIQEASRDHNSKRLRNDRE
jgi:hypothetical protein